MVGFPEIARRVEFGIERLKIPRSCRSEGRGGVVSEVFEFGPGYVCGQVFCNLEKIVFLSD